MKTVYKVLISFAVGVCLILTGIAIDGLSQLTSINVFENIDIRWNAKQIDDIDMNIEYVDNIEIDVSNVNVSFHEDDSFSQIRIYATHLYEGFYIQQQDHVLVIKQPQYWWKKYSDFQAQIDIYVPTGYLFHTVDYKAGFGQTTLSGLNADNIKINTGFGKMNLDDISCQTLELETGLGQTSGYHISCQNLIKVDVGMGSVSLDLHNISKDYDYKVDVGLGNVTIDALEFSGITDQQSLKGNQLMIDVDCGMGNINIKTEG